MFKEKLKYKLIFLSILLSFSTFGNNKFSNSVDSILNAAANLPSKEKIDILIGQGKKYRYKAELEVLMIEAVQEANKLGDIDYIVYTKYHLGNFYGFNSKIDTAIAVLEKIAFLAKDVSDPFMEPSIVNAIGGFYIGKGAVSNGINKLLKAKQLYESIDSASLGTGENQRLVGNLGVVLNSLAIANQKIENYSEALVYYEKAKDCFLQLNNYKYLGAILSNKGDLLNKLERFEDAVESLKLAKEYKVKAGSSSTSKALTELNLGMSYFGLKAYDTAIEIFDKVYYIFQEENYQTGIMYAVTELGLSYYQKGIFEAAAQNCKLGYQLSQQIKDIEYNAKACKCLANSYAKENEYDKAYQFLKEFNTLKDSTLNAENIKKFAALEMEHAFEKERAIAALQAKEKRKKNRIRFLSMAAMLLLTLVVIGLLWQRSVTTKKTALVLEEKNNIILQALNDKDMLIKEIHHRVKNNLQLVSSFLRLQLRDVSDNKAAEALREGRNRVMSMALIHQNLYQDGSLVGVDVRDYIYKLTKRLFENYNIHEDKIQLHMDIDTVKLDVNQIIPLGLILNELVTNALKYAFDNGQQGEIKVQLKEKNEHIEFKVEDNGKGLSPDFDVNSKKSLGFKLIKSFAHMLKADYKFENDKGTHFILKMKLPEKFKVVIS